MTDDVQVVKYTNGQMIFKEGQIADSVYLVLSGKVKVTQGEGASTVFLAELGEESVFGEMALIDNTPRSATVMAIGNVECYKAGKANFSKVLATVDPSVKKMLDSLVSIIREKNKSKLPGKLGAFKKDKNALDPELQKKINELKKDMFSSVTLNKKIGELDPFMSGILRALSAIAYE